MKKFFIIFILTFFFCLPLFAAETQKYKVIKIVDGDTIYIDFNKDKKANKDERIRIDGIDSFEISVSHGTF